ncbi:MAG: hypothetical protein L6407_05200 [Candidatus Delongbacteria bacterium]|nr:hypothetical protein [Candidatus Delongbacteria bacterium]
MEVLATEKIIGYDSYYYIRYISFNGIKPKRTELIFCLDILEAVILSFQPPDTLHAVRKALNIHKSAWAKASHTNTLKGTDRVVTCLYETTNNVHLLYGKKHIILKLLADLRRS